jgi:hypothetical protein
MNFHKNVKIALPWCGLMLSSELTFCLVSVFKLVHKVPIPLVLILKKTPKSKMEVKPILEIELELGIGLLLEAKLAQKPIL